MGRHSADGGHGRGRKRGSRGPREIRRLEPASSSSESFRELDRRRKGARRGVDIARRQRRLRGFALGCLATLGIVLLVGGIFGYGYLKRFEESLRVDHDSPKNLAPAPDRSEPFYILVLGSDVRPKENTARSDTIIVARVDPQGRKISMVSIPRDSRVDVPGRGKTKINAAMAYGGPDLMIRTVQEYTGLPISYYVLVNFEGFKEMVDAVGGVYVDVPKPIRNDLQASNYVRQAATVEAGYQKLDGLHALTFVRSRKFPDGDFQRIKDQQIFIKALFRQTLRWQNVFRTNSILEAVGDNVQTNLSLGQLVSLARGMKGMKDSDLETSVLPGEARTIGDASYVVLDEEKSRALLDRMRAGESLESTSAGSPSLVARPEQVTVTVKNGAGVGGVAQRVADRLERRGFDVGETGNMNRFVYDETLIVYKTHEEKASLVRESLSFGELVQSRHMYSFSTDVLVVVGKDCASRPSGVPVR